MRCDRCRRTDRAVFARMLPDDAYARVCGRCRDAINAEIPMQLQRLDADVLRDAGMEAPTRQSTIRQRFLKRGLMALTAVIMGKWVAPRMA
jgi:hypothetical protein